LESAIGKTTVDGGLLYSTLEIFIGKWLVTASHFFF
jgi:hypothetical protein